VDAINLLGQYHTWRAIFNHREGNHVADEQANIGRIIRGELVWSNLLPAHIIAGS